VSIDTWPQVRSRFVFQRRDVRGVDAPLASATKDGVFLRDDLDISVWNPGSDVSNYKLVEPDDFVIGLRSFQHGISHSEARGIVSPAYTVLRGTAAVEPRYFKYYFRSALLVSQLANITQGIRQGQTIDTEAFSNLMLPAPPLDEQRRIADFLDAETARIDELVRLRNLQVDNLAEALRSEAGRITDPEWKPLPLRRVVKSVQTGTTPTDLLLPADVENVPWYTPAALGGNLDLNSAEKSVSQDDFDTVPRFPAESILIVGIGESLGKVADLDHEATGNQQLTAIRIYSSADRRFVLWRLFAAYEEIRAWAQYSRVRILNNEVLKSFKIPFPPLDQQVKVRQDLDRRLREFTEFRDAGARFSLLANERRQALITAAVTGGISV
jgi:type I restriction enzyme S subunit